MFPNKRDSFQTIHNTLQPFKETIVTAGGLRAEVCHLS